MLAGTSLVRSVRLAKVAVGTAVVKLCRNLTSGSVQILTEATMLGEHLRESFISIQALKLGRTAPTPRWLAPTWLSSRVSYSWRNTPVSHRGAWIARRPYRNIDVAPLLTLVLKGLVTSVETVREKF